MTLKDGMRWFKDNFETTILDGIKDTPFSLDLITAIAIQESFEVWGRIYDDATLSVDDVLRLCVGDTLDAPDRGAFPLNKADLTDSSVVDGEQMFDIARQALVDMADYISDYQADARDPDAFCHGFGIFQYDIQSFKDEPDFFLKKRWYDFGECLKVAIGELNEKLNLVYGPQRYLTDDEMVYVAIAYNQGDADTSRDFKQGFKDSDGVYYGEHIQEYMQLSKTT